MPEHKFSIQNQLRQEKAEFEKDITISTSSRGRASDKIERALGDTQGLSFNQLETLETVDHYMNDTFKSGQTDEQGRRKLFLNIVSFKTDVAKKQVDLDVKDYLFIPEEGTSSFGSYLLQREFKDWASDSDYSELKNELVADYCKYGTAVVKDTKNGLERLNLKTLINDQTADNLQDADFVIEEHCEMDYDDLKEHPDWNIEQLDLTFGDTVTIFERHGKVPRAYFLRQKGREDEIEEEDYRKGIETMAIIAEESSQGDGLLYIEEEKDRPYHEAHFEKVDGRWLGKGPAEKQFENQVAANMTVNMIRRSLNWSSRKIFQTTDSNIADNLLKQVEDGDILELDDGEVGQVETASQSLSEFQQHQNIWQQNSKRKAFTFEAATGESMPSGTPFRLGAILSKTANSYFRQKRERLGVFFKNLTRDFILPKFKKEKRRSHMLTLFNGEPGVRQLAEEIIQNKVDEKIKKEMLKGNLVNPNQIKEEVKQDVLSQDKFVIKIPDGFYEKLIVKTDIVLTGEAENVESRIATLKTNYKLAKQRGDPRAGKILDKINALAGENLSMIAGKRQTVRKEARTVKPKDVGEVGDIELQPSNPTKPPESAQEE